MLHKKCAVPVGTATFAVGMVGFFEGAIFGLMMMTVLLLNAPMWIQYLGEEYHLQSLQTISGLTLLGIGVVIVAAFVGRRIIGEPVETEEEFLPHHLDQRCLQSNGKQSDKHSVYCSQ